MWQNKFIIGTDYKVTFSEEVTQLIAQELTTEFKNKLITILTEEYVKQTGDTPDSYELNRLATWLVEDKSRDPHKVAKTEYPILSENQQKYRKRREVEQDRQNDLSDSGIHKLNGKRTPKNFKVFGEYEGGY